MDPGEFNKRVIILVPYPEGRDSAGAPQTGLYEIARPWAKVTEQSGREFIRSDGEQTERKVVFRIWRTSELARLIATTSVVRYRDVDHDVQATRDFDDILEIMTVAPAPPSPDYTGG